MLKHHNAERAIQSTNSAWIIEIHMQKEEEPPCYHTYQNLLKIDQIVKRLRAKTIKLLAENREKLHDGGFGNVSYKAPKVQAIKAKTDKWNYIKIKTSIKMQSTQ